MNRRIAILFLLAVFIACESRAGWFSDTNFYVVVQQTPSGKFVDGWVVQGLPQNSNGIYVFTIYGTKIEKHIPIQSVVVTKIGSDVSVAERWLSAEREDSANGFHKGF